MEKVVFNEMKALGEGIPNLLSIGDKVKDIAKEDKQSNSRQDQKGEADKGSKTEEEKG